MSGETWYDEKGAPTAAYYRHRLNIAEKLIQDAGLTLAFGIEGKLDRDTAYHEAFAALYGFCFGPDAALVILAEGKRT